MNKKTADLYAPVPAVGMLKGFSPLPHQLEVDVVVPHQEGGMPGFGEFLLVELGDTEALVGRVSRYHAAGQLTTERGDAYLSDIAKTEDGIPPAMMRRVLRYTLKVQLLGHLESGGLQNGFSFTVGQRAFATLGKKVRVPSDAALAYLCNVGLEDDPTAVKLGHLVYGQRELPDVPVRFSVARLKGRRSFVFARAGYGKSNLIKYLMAQLYSAPPDVGLLIFDPEGEYALPDAHGRPGMVNVPGLRHRISLYTQRHVDPQFANVVKGTTFLDFRDFPPQDIVAAVIPQEKQDAVFANLVRSQDWQQWKALVDLLAEKGFATEDTEIARLLRYRARKDDVSLAAIKNNLVPAIRRFHRAGSTLGKNILEELRQGRVVIVDVSFLTGEDSLAVTGMLLWRIFQHNLRHLTDVAQRTVRCVAILEEAQTLLGDRRLDDRDVFVRWVKEGRKYGLGCVLITQQPSSISSQIISQGDNFFVFHLLNDGDLQTLKKHNAYFTDEILGFIRAEPIAGNCYFWSAPSQPFVLSARVCDFESICQSTTAPTAPEQEPEPARTEARLDPGKLAALTARAVQSALAVNPRLWLYPVGKLLDQAGDGWVAFSRDYLHDIVAATVADEAQLRHSPEGPDWIQAKLPVEIETVLKRHNVRSGYAALAGVVRPVWALPLAEFELQAGKTLQPRPADVTAGI
ncbi:MAG: ATP-binding protein [Verrucomicrobiae bacterium]|nr:ATP-binding protein [Verrucomicrobiae bacterium]